MRKETDSRRVRLAVPWLVVALASLALLGRDTTLGAYASTCRESDADALVLRSYVRELVTSTSSDRVQLRIKLGLKAMDSTKVTLVSDNRICDKVAQGINAKMATGTLSRIIYVVSVGTDYAAQDPDNPSGEWWPTFTLDNKYKVKGVVLAP